MIKREAGQLDAETCPTEYPRADYGMPGEGIEDTLVLVAISFGRWVAAELLPLPRYRASLEGHRP